MRIIRFSFSQPKRRAFRLGFSMTAIVAAVAAQIIFFTSQAYALGLGNLTVNSYLDEPLDLRVELILDPGIDDLEQIVFDLASRKEFSIAGISRPEFMDEIQFEILPENGKNWLRISSVSQMREPFLHILLRAEWGGGSLLREYTALIDPPVYSSQAPAPIMAPRIREEFGSSGYAENNAENSTVYTQTDSVPLVSETTTNTAEQYSGSSANDSSLSGSTPVYDQSSPGQSSTSQSSTSQSSTSQSSTSQSSTSQSSTTQPLPVDEAFGVYGPIEAGETLSGIAAQLQQVYPELGYYQTLYVLHRDNQDAFIDGNMNLLKKGEILRVDSLDDIGNVSRDVAVQVFQEQQGEWQGYLADRGKVVPTYVASETPTNSAQGTIGEGDSQLSASGGASVAQDQFRIGSAEGAGQSSSGVVDDARTLQIEISSLESSLLSSQLENSELRERLELLEIQLDEVNQLIALEDPTLAALQQGLGNATSVEAADSASSNNEAPPNIVGIGTAAMVSNPTDINSATDSSPNGSGAGISSGQALIDQSEAASGSSEGASPAPLLIINERSWLDRVTSYLPKIDFQNTTTLGIIGAVIAALCALLFFRRRRAQEEFEHSMLSMAVEGAHSQFDLPSVHEGVDLDEDRPGDARSLDKDSSFLTVYNDDVATVHSDDVDPLAEAEVYLAYGRDDQAIEVLSEGLKRAGDRFDIRAKLLQIYHKQENKAEFESLAEQFYADKKVSEDKLWRRIVKMGQELELTNPIFATTGDAMERLSSLLEVDSLEDLGISEKLSEQVSEIDEGHSDSVSTGVSTSMGAEPDVTSSLDFDSIIEENSSLQVRADLDANDSVSPVSALNLDSKDSSKFSDVVIEVESVIEEMSSVDILDPAGSEVESSSTLDSESIENNSQDLSGYGDKVAADIETAASYLAPGENLVETESAQASDDEVLLQTPSVESISYFGVDPTLPLGSDLDVPTPHNDSILEFDTHSVSSQLSVSDPLEIPSILDEPSIDTDDSSINLDEPSSLLDVSSGASIQIDDSQTNDSLAFDEQVSNPETLDISTVDLPSETLANSKPTASDSEFNVDLAESIDQYSEMLTPDTTAVGELSELSDLMISESASDISSIQAPLDAEDIQTQLDLAQVYVELGDGEGAGQILKDVMEYGNSDQKKQAADILSELKV